MAQRMGSVALTLAFLCLSPGLPVTPLPTASTLLRTVDSLPWASCSAKTDEPISERLVVPVKLHVTQPLLTCHAILLVKYWLHYYSPGKSESQTDPIHLSYSLTVGPETVFRDTLVQVIS